MSGFESTIWTILGYVSMPIIFIVGYVAITYISCLLLNYFYKSP